MGRPPLNDKAATHATVVRLTTELRDRIESVAGKGQMAAFIRAAIEAELEKREADHRD